MADARVDVDAALVELVDERFAAIKRQHLPSYLELLKTWRESLKSTEEWMVNKEKEFVQYADTVISQYQKGPMALHDHTYCFKEEECAFTPHYCSEKCWTMGSVVESPSKYSSLSLPLLLGWQRILLLRPASENNRTDTYYSAPCGRRLRSMEEVQQFLQSTCSEDSNISITNFTFDPFCSLICPPYNAKTAGAKVFIPDITCNTEAIPITCVNSLTSELPEHFEYISRRVAGPGVHIETDSRFLVSCSCTDNCSNRSKCECWQLTVQEAQTGGPTRHSIGYAHGRLKRPQHSAIYECNRMCSCGPKCGNRVVQRGVEHHLQVFRTQDRGWGLRTLRDIPAGSFICTYVGQIFPEHTLESQGGHQPTPIVDEYFAELDYIEVMENHKEGYESEMEFSSDTFSESSGSEDESYDINSSTVKEFVHELTSNPASDDDTSISLSSSAPSPHSPATPQVPTTTHTSATPQVPTTTHTSATPQVPTTTHTSTTSTQTPPIIGSMVHVPHPQTGHLQSADRPSCISTDIKPSANRPTPIPTTPTSHLPHLHIERRIISPHDHLVPISPRKLHGMRTRQYYSEDFSYIIDAKDKGNIGRYINHSCSPDMFVQNVFVDTHDLRFPWVAFFARNRIKALQELTWDYSYEVGSVEGKVIYCRCKSLNCRGRLI